MVRVPEQDDERESRRATFDRVAEQYDAARPTYPDALLHDLVELARIPSGGRILEIGPGTGKASVALAERGFELVGVELGEELAAVARRRLAGFPAARVVVADFEQWEPEHAELDAIVAFTSFHWIAPELRYTKSARLLRRGGALAVVDPEHVLLPGADGELWVAMEAIFTDVAPHPENGLPPAPDDVGDLREEIEASGLFDEVIVRRHLWNINYTADEFVALLGTYSRMLLLPESQRDELCSRIHALVTEHGGVVTQTNLGVLNVARR
jgi:SAM-dependent methyltransferase